MILVDHKDGNTLNNRRGNLRAATKSQNAMNRRATIKSKTGVKNISWSERDKKYYLHINHKHYGVFDTIEDAKVKRDKILSVVHGEFENRD